MKTGAEYKDSLRQLKTVIYAFGEQIIDMVDNPLFQPHINAAALTYDLAHDSVAEDLVSATSHLTGKKISRFTHIHQSTEDLLKKVKMLRMISQHTGSCYQRCVGFDALNATYTVTYEMDQKLGTNYHQRFLDFLNYVQETDIMICGAMTDVKGDRGFSPSQQQDPDMYVHVVDQNDQGIIIRGAKAHMTGVVNSHEMLIMPTTAMKEDDKNYAVCCAVPVDAPGITHVFGRQCNDDRKYGTIDQGNATYGIVGGEALTIFEDVFIPWEKVFMFGEWQFTGLLVERFACYHRMNYGGCKGGVADIIIGAAATVADYNGATKASHIKDKITEMIHLTETLYSGSIACACEGRPTASGAYFVDPLLANVVKHNVTRLIYEISRLSHDIAGGVMATLPSEKDFKHEKVGKLIEKYFKGAANVATEDRVRILRLLENMTAGTALVESMHGAGSPQAQRVAILRQGNLEHKKRLAKKLAGIPNELAQ